MDKAVLSLLGLARRASKAALGEEQVCDAIRARTARLVFVASDCAANASERLDRFVEDTHIVLLTVPWTKAELGAAIGWDACAAAAFTDMGLAASALKKLSEADPETYGAPYAALDVKAEKMKRRKREKARRKT